MTTVIEQKKQRLQKFDRAAFFQRYGVGLALILLIAFNLVVTPNFATSQTLAVNLTQVCTIVIVGVGLGRDSEYVTKTFDHHVYGVNLADIPRPLVAKLHELVLGGGVGQRRGRKVRAA